MSIDSLTSTSSSHRAHLQQIRQDLSAIHSDLQSGSITQARTDFAALLDDAPRLKSALSSSPAASSSTIAANSGSALSAEPQSGEVTGASTALTSSQQTVGSTRHHPHRRHHSGGYTGGGADGNGPGSSTVETDMQTLSSALQSGDLVAAQQALTQLQKDDPSLTGSPTVSGTSTRTALV